MKLRIVFLALALATGSAWAEWVRVSKDNSKGRVYYIDPSTIIKNGDLRKVWSIQNLNYVGKDGERSRRTRFEFDCEKDMGRILYLSFHSRQMLEGETLWSSGDPTPWGEIPPNSVLDTIRKIVCAV